MAIANQDGNRRRPRAAEELVLRPLGGCGEIGMNAYLDGLGRGQRKRWRMVDFGVKFGDERDPGIEVILPDTQFIESQRNDLEAIVLTHAHEDHFGAVSYLWPRLRVPVYATPFAAWLLRDRLRDSGLEDEVPLHEVPVGSRVAIGGFDVEFIPVTHSIPESNALAIRTEAGTVLHSGDWKLDDRPMAGRPMAIDRLQVLAEEGCRALVCDSTNALREGESPSESDAAVGLAEVIAGAKQRVAVTIFASNVGRILAVARAAQETGRHMVVAGRAFSRILEAARDTGYLPPDMEFLPPTEFGYLPPDKVICLCTGSQGERRAALARIADGSHPDIALEEGDLVIFSAKTIPGNEKAVFAVQNKLAELGIHIVTAEQHLVHVSGHPRRQELARFYDWVRPELLVPMHGEAMHMLEQASLAQACGIPETLIVRNGEVARLAPGPAEVLDEAPAGRLHVDGRLIVPSDGPAKVRRKMSFAGFVAVSIVLNRKGDLVGEPLIETAGLPETTEDGQPFRELLLSYFDAIIDGMAKPRRREDQPVETALYQGIRKAAELHWGKKPMCRIFLNRI